MKTLLPLLLALAGPARAEMPLVTEMGAIMNLFDGGRAPHPFSVPQEPAKMRKSAPVDASQWAPVPEVGASAPAAAPAGDAFAGLEECQVVDLVYVRQPSLPEAVGALTPCLEAVSKRYGASATAAADQKALVIRIPVTAAESPLARDLAAGVAKRGGLLVGFPARVSAELAPVRARGVSVLQPILERCAGPKMLPRDAEDFVTVYGACLKAERSPGFPSE